MNAVAKEVDNDKEARIAIEKFCESFEKEILGEFDKAYEEGDPRVMAVNRTIGNKKERPFELKICVLALCQSVVRV